MNFDIFQTTQQVLNSLVNSQSSLFLGQGQILFHLFAVMIICVYGLRVALDADSFSAASLAQVIFAITVCNIVVTYYYTPLPAWGESFAGLIIHETSWITNQIGGDTYDQLASSCQLLSQQLPGPTFGNITATLFYWAFTLALAIFEAVVFLIAAFGLVMQSLLLLLGPLFVPFFIVPGLSFIGWGWLKSFLQYTWYQVIANAFCWVVAKIGIAFLTYLINTVKGSGWSYATATLPLFFLTGSAVWGITHIPSITTSIFSGRAGEFALPGKSSTPSPGGASGANTGSAGSAASTAASGGSAVEAATTAAASAAAL